MPAGVMTLQGPKKGPAGVTTPLCSLVPHALRAKSRSKSHITGMGASQSPSRRDGRCKGIPRWQQRIAVERFV